MAWIQVWKWVKLQGRSGILLRWKGPIIICSGKTNCTEGKERREEKDTEEEKTNCASITGKKEQQKHGRAGIGEGR